MSDDQDSKITVETPTLTQVQLVHAAIELIEKIERELNDLSDQVVELHDKRRDLAVLRRQLQALQIDKA